MSASASGSVSESPRGGDGVAGDDDGDGSDDDAGSFDDVDLVKNYETLYAP